MLSYPLTRQVQIVFPIEKQFNCSLEEAVVNDTTSGDKR